MLSPQEVVNSLTTDEFITMCQLSPGKFDVLKITRYPEPISLYVTVVPRHTTGLATTLVMHYPKSA